MRKYMCIIFILFNFCNTALAQQTGIHFFEGTWQQALDKAAKENKLIFLDCYTTWCPPCAYLANSVFTRDDMGSFYNTHFVNVKLDAEKEPGLTVAKKYGITAYPTLSFINARGYLIEQMLGVKNPDTLLSWPLQVIPLIEVPTAEERFDKGDRSDSFIVAYSNKFIANGKANKVSGVLSRLMKEKGDAVLLHAAYWPLLKVIPVDSVPARFFVKHLQRFQQLHPNKEVMATLAAMYTAQTSLSALYHPGPPRNFLPERYQALLEKMETDHIPGQDYLKGKIQFYRHCRSTNIQQAFVTADSILRNAEGWQYLDIAQMANKYFRNEYRKRAARWAEKAALLSDDIEQEKQALKVAQDLLTLPYITFDPSTY